MLERDNLDEAIKHLQRANDLAKEQKLNFGDDIAIQLRIARKKRWNIQEEKRIQQEIELQTYLNRLILEDRDRKIDDLRKTGEDVDLQVGFGHSAVVYDRTRVFVVLYGAVQYGIFGGRTHTQTTVRGTFST